MQSMSPPHPVLRFLTFEWLILDIKQFLNTDSVEYCEASDEFLIAFIHSKDICGLLFKAPGDKAVKLCHQGA